MTDTVVGDEDEMMNAVAAEAINAPPVLSVFDGGLIAAFKHSVEGLKANEVAEVVEMFGAKKARSKKGNIENLIQNMKDRLSTVEVWGEELSIKDLNRMAENGALGNQVGRIVKLVRFDEATDSEQLWNNTAKFVETYKVKIGEKKLKNSKGKIRIEDETILSIFETDMRIIQTSKHATKHRRYAVGYYDHINTNKVDDLRDRETPQMHHVEWRLRCFNRMCRTKRGVDSFVRAVGMGAALTHNPPQESKAEIYTNSTPPQVLFDNQGQVVVEDTVKARMASRCPTCSGRVRWSTRLAGGYSSKHPVGGWAATVKLPTEKNRIESGRVQSNRCVNVEMNNGSPRIATTFDELDGCLPYGLYAQGWNQRHGYAPNAQRYTLNKDGSRKGIRKTIHLPCSIQRRIGIVRTHSGATFPVLFWAAIHDINGLARGIDNSSIETVEIMLRILQRRLNSNGSKIASTGVDLLNLLKSFE